MLNDELKANHGLSVTLPNVYKRLLRESFQMVLSNASEDVKHLSWYSSKYKFYQKSNNLVENPGKVGNGILAATSWQIKISKKGVIERSFEL